MPNDMKREMTSWSEQEFVSNRYTMWLGADMPKTISAKEIIDNGLDQAADKRAKNIHIQLDKNKVVVMDDGHGISTKMDENTGMTHLYLAFGKLYTSTNYDGTEGLAGNFGVGGSATNFLSEAFICGNVNKGILQGYIFNNGEHRDKDQTLDIVKNIEFPMQKGFYVSAEFNGILEDDIDFQFLKNYIAHRVGELPQNVSVTLEYDGKTFNYDKIKGSNNYIYSWDERTKENTNISVIKGNNGFVYAFAEDVKYFNGMAHIVQGAPVKNIFTTRYTFEIEGENIAVTIPFSFKYAGKEAPKYQDQTKQLIRVYSPAVHMAFEKSKVYAHFKRKAEELYLKDKLKGNDSQMFWPALGKEDLEILVGEGSSAVFGIKAMRDPMTQACFSIRGKFMNCYKKDLKYAMKSDIVKQFIQAINSQDYKRIVICVDADTDGSHIGALFYGLIWTFAPHMFDEGRVYYCNTPLYIFNKGKEIQWSDNKNDCPKGFSYKTNKGLGSLNKNEVKMFITNKETRQIIQIKMDENAEQSLDTALKSCGAEWVNVDKSKIYQPAPITKDTKEITITDYVYTKYREFWEQVNKDKNSFDVREQLPQVISRMIWAAHKLNMYEGAKVKTTDLAAETAKYHIAGDASLQDTVKESAAEYKRQPVLRLLKGLSNMGAYPGDPGAAARYTMIMSTPLMGAILKDIPYMDKNEDNEAMWISAPIPFALMGGIRQIGLGESCMFAERDAREVLNWLKDTSQAVPAPMSHYGCDVWVSDKGYTVYDAKYHTEGKYDIITNIPILSTVQSIISTLKEKLPKKVTDGILDGSGENKPIWIMIPKGYISDKNDWVKLGLRIARKENYLIWDHKMQTMKYSSLKEVADMWLESRDEIVRRRFEAKKKSLEKDIHEIDLIRLFVEKGMGDWKVEDIEKELGQADADLVLSKPRRMFMPENLNKNDVISEKKSMEIKEINEKIKNIREVILKEAWEILEKQEKFFED